MTASEEHAEHVLGPQGALRAAVGLLLGAILGGVIALLTPRRDKHDA